MRKEYNDRWNAPLVNPGFTMEEYELQHIRTRLEAEVKELEKSDKLKQGAR